jgi:hypothetical protein
MGKTAFTAVLDWIDGRNPWQFVAILYAARWGALAPVMAFNHFVFSATQKSAAPVPEEWSQGSPVGLFMALVAIPPLVETIVECSLPYWIISHIRDYRTNRPKRCWGFVAVSACVMAVLHPMVAAQLPALVTGAFLAYCYAHFAPISIWKAILATTVFHGAINMVGWTMLVLA